MLKLLKNRLVSRRRCVAWHVYVLVRVVEPCVCIAQHNHGR